jgi:propionyl-CoA carboxylase beta chain
VAEFREKLANPFVAAAKGSWTRSSAAHHAAQADSALALLENKRDKNPPKKHGNIPL